MFTSPKRVAELEKKIAKLETQPPAVQINMAEGASYQDFRGATGEFHVHLDGKAEVISAIPVEINEVGVEDQIGIADSIGVKLIKGDKNEP